MSRAQLKKRIAGLIAEGKDQIQIAQILNDEGIRTPSGGKMFNNKTVSFWARKFGLHKFKHKRAGVPRQKRVPQNSMTDMVGDILTSNLSEETKLAAIKGIIQGLKE